MLRKLSNSEYAKNSFILIFGTGLAQLIPILLQPVLRRLFTDEEFGIFAQFYSIVSVLSIVSNLRYSNSIVIPKSDKDALSILAGSILLNFITSLVFFILFIFFGATLFNAIGFSKELVNYIWMLPVSIFLIATNISYNFWLTRKKKYIGMAVNKGVRRISEGGMQIALSNGFQKGGLIIGSLIGDFLNLLMFLFQFKKAEGSFKGIDSNSIKNALGEQREFPRHSLFPALLDVVSMNLPIFIISSYYSKSIVGQFDGSRQLLAIPLALISISLSQVLYQKIVETNNEHKHVSPIVRQNFIFLGILSILGVLIFLPFGIPIYTFVFGKEWQLAGEMSQILVASYAIRFLISPLSIVFIALKKMKISALWQIFYFISMLSLLFFNDLSIQDFLFYFVVIDVVAYIVYGVLIYFTLKAHDKNVG